MNLRALSLTLSCAFMLGSIHAPVTAQTNSPAIATSTFKFERMTPPQQKDAIPLGTGPQAPDFPEEEWFRMNGDINVRNVSAATLMPFLPAPDKATGTAVIVAPGGGFLGLAIETEGFAVARWLSEHGIAAFVLKYRLVPTPRDFDVFTREMVAGRSGKPSSLRLPSDTPGFARDDGLAALALVRSRAKAWGIAPTRIGIMGFSAGAFTTLTTALEAKPGERPAFIAPIYGRLTPKAVPNDAPPMFAVLAADDHFFASQGSGLVDAWMQAGRPVEFHLYQNGGHGFGLGKPNTTSAGWTKSFMIWLQANGFLKAR